MLKILVPVDDANLSRYAIQHVIHRAWSRDALEIHLIHLQPAVNGYVAWFARSALQDSRAESSAKAFKAAGKLLDRGGLQYSTLRARSSATPSQTGSAASSWPRMGWGPSPRWCSDR